MLRDERVLGEVSTWTDETYSSRMFRHLDFLLRELSLKGAETSLVSAKMERFDLYAVAAGPGSFTGLRVGLTAVKGWAEVHQKPIAAVGALEAVAAQAQTPVRWLVPVIDARRGQVFVGIYERSEGGLKLHGNEVVMTPAEFLDHVRAKLAEAAFAFVSPTPEVIAPHIAEAKFAGKPVEAVSTVLAPWIGRLGFARAQRGELVDALHLDAHYIRRSDAELLFKAPRG